MPETLLQKLFIRVGNKLESKTTSEHTWCGRHVKVLDGSTVSMPDTTENQKAYPQPSSQKAGCGFPLAKIMVLFSITTGAAIGIIIDVFKTHDLKLARQLYNYLNPGDIALGDRAFCAYSDIYFLQKQSCDAIFRKHQGRKNQIKKGKRICPCDCLVTWQKPKSCPLAYLKRNLTSYPPNLLLREVHYYICIRRLSN